jgi:serine/threonine protein kinase
LYRGSVTILKQTHPVAIKYLVTDKQVKNIHGLSVKVSDTSEIVREINILGKLRGVAGIVHIYDSHQVTSPVKMLVNSTRPEYATLLPGYYLYLEYCSGGDLCDVVINSGALSELATRIIIKRLVTIILECHQAGVIHRDLKLENILLNIPSDTASSTLTDCIKVTDVGLATEYQPGNTFTEKIGTNTYLSPEQVEGQAYTEKCDIWTIGIIMYTLLYGFTPFDRESERATNQAIVRGIESDRALFPHSRTNVSPESIRLIKKILQPESNRPSLETLLQDPWLVVSDQEESRILVKPGRNPIIFEQGLGGGRDHTNPPVMDKMRVDNLRNWVASQRVLKLQRQLERL